MGKLVVTYVSPPQGQLIRNGAVVSMPALGVSEGPEGYLADFLVRMHFDISHRERHWQGTNLDLLSSEDSITITSLLGESLRPWIGTERDLAVAEGWLKYWKLSRLDTGEALPDNWLQDRNILIVGGSGGIGSACAQDLAARGAKVHCPTRQKLNLREKECWPELSGYDAVIHAAAVYNENLEETFSVNVFSIAELLAAAVTSGWQGRMVFLSSVAGAFGRPSLPFYSASKAALTSLVESRARDLAEKGILINAVAPAKVDTRMQAILNPEVPRNYLIPPRLIATAVRGVLCSNLYGRVVYVRKGFEDSVTCLPARPQV